MKDTLEKKIAFIIIVMSFLTIFFSAKVSAVEQENEYEMYNIEDIIFNKIPIFDINFFSSKAGGKDVKVGSLVYTLKNIVATWYVSFRNLVIMALSILLVYTGIRMAMSTIPSNKAKYKKMLFGWLQSLIIVLTIHYIMLIVINLNETVVTTVEQTQTQMIEDGWEEESIYDTIRTRANDTRFTIGMPAMIMYVVLVIIWVRFIWVYIKRSFTILILVIVAPFIGAKYALDSSKGKKGTSFTSWMYDFVMNVFLQSVHAIVYTALISTALNLSKQSLMGFVMALVFFNFMLGADEIFRNIFNFNKSKLLGETAKQDGKNIMKNFEGLVFVGQMAKGGIGLAKFAGSTAMGLGKAGYKKINAINPNIEGKINYYLNKIDRKIEEKVDPSQNDKDGILKDIQNALYYEAKIRRLSREKGSRGIKARRLKNKLKANKSKRYKSNFKFVKDSITGVGSIVFAVPLTVVSPSAGIALATSGILTLHKQSKGTEGYKTKLKGYKNLGPYKVYYSTKEAKEKYKKKRDNIYKSIRNIDEINNKEDEIKNKFANLRENENITEEQIESFKETISTVSLEANRSTIIDSINKYLKDNKIKDIDKSTINDIIDNVVDNLGNNINLDDRTKRKIQREATNQILRQNAKKDNEDPENKYSNNDVSKIITQKVLNETVNKEFKDKEFKDIAKEIISLESKINEAEKTAKTNYRHVNKFLENL